MSIIQTYLYYTALGRTIYKKIFQNETLSSKNHNFLLTNLKVAFKLFVSSDANLAHS